MLWAGKEAYIFLDLNRWDDRVLENFRSVTRTSDPLRWPARDVGTMMLHSEQAISVSLFFPYFNKAKYKGMPSTVFFPNCWYEGPEDFSVNGTNPRKVHLTIHSLAEFTGTRRTLGFQY
jgi:hypothetical protein